MAILLTVKLSFFLVAAPMYLLTRVVWPTSGQRRTGGVIGVVGSAVFGIALAGGPGPLLAYVKWVLAIHVPVSPLLLVFHYVQYTTTAFLVLVGWILCALAWTPDRVRSLILPSLYCVLGLGVVMVATASCVQDFEVMPCVGVLVLALAATTVRSARPAGPDGKLLAASAIVAFLLLAAPVKDALLSRAFSRLHVPTFAEADAGDVHWGEIGYRYNLPAYYAPVESVVPEMEEGLSLLEDVVKPGQTVWVATNGYPLEHCLHLMPVRGDTVGYMNKFYADPARHPLLPGFSLDGVVAILRSKEHDYAFPAQMSRPETRKTFEEQFQQVKETGRWILYLRRPIE